MNKVNHKNSESSDLGKFPNFLRAFGATRVLLQRAHEQGFLIEGLILYAALADGFCRICLVLKEQLEKKNGDINQKYIYQHDDEKNFNERGIYKLALKRKIIGKKLFKELNTLYDIRNKMIHRFFISEVEYSHLEIVCSRYEQVYNELWNITHDLESEQIKKGVGMTIQGNKMTETEKVNEHLDISKKIKSRSEKNLAKTLGCTSVDEVVEFASDNGLLVECTCGHIKVMHIDLKTLKKKESTDLNEGLSKCSMDSCDCSKFILKSTKK